MSKIGLFFGSNDGDTRDVANLIANLIGKEKVEIYDVKVSKKEDLLKFDRLILAASTHGDGVLQSDFAKFLTDFSDEDFNSKIIALVGIGGQIRHPDTFCNGLKELKEKVKKAKIIGYGLTDGFTFKHSKALENGKFIGLCLDQKAQASMSESRIKAWLKLVEKDLKI